MNIKNVAFSLVCASFIACPNTITAEVSSSSLINTIDKQAPTIAIAALALLGIAILRHSDTSASDLYRDHGETAFWILVSTAVSHVTSYPAEWTAALIANEAKSEDTANYHIYVKSLISGQSAALVNTILHTQFNKQVHSFFKGYQNL